MLDLLPCQQDWRLSELLRTAQERRFYRRIVTKAGGSAFAGSGITCGSQRGLNVPVRLAHRMGINRHEYFAVSVRVMSIPERSRAPSVRKTRIAEEDRRARPLSLLDVLVLILLTDT